MAIQENVQKGDSLGVLRADTLNTLFDAGRAFLATKTDMAGDEKRTKLPSTSVYVALDPEIPGERVYGRGDIMTLGEPVIKPVHEGDNPPATIGADTTGYFQALDTFLTLPTFYATEINDNICNDKNSRGSFVILEEDFQENGFARAKIAGTAMVKVNIISKYHKYADVVLKEYGNEVLDPFAEMEDDVKIGLKSVYRGSLRILWSQFGSQEVEEDTLGEQWCVVEFTREEIDEAWAKVHMTHISHRFCRLPIEGDNGYTQDDPEDEESGWSLPFGAEFISDIYGTHEILYQHNYDDEEELIEESDYPIQTRCRITTGNNMPAPYLVRCMELEEEVEGGEEGETEFKFYAVYCDKDGIPAEEDYEVTNYMPIDVNFFGEVAEEEEE